MRITPSTSSIYAWKRVIPNLRTRTKQCMHAARCSFLFPWTTGLLRQEGRKLVSKKMGRRANPRKQTKKLRVWPGSHLDQTTWCIGTCLSFLFRRIVSANWRLLAPAAVELHEVAGELREDRPMPRGDGLRPARFRPRDVFFGGKVGLLPPFCSGVEGKTQRKTTIFGGFKLKQRQAAGLPRPKPEAFLSPCAPATIFYFLSL